jgi:hypothetical protein
MPPFRSKAAAPSIFAKRKTVDTPADHQAANHKRKHRWDDRPMEHNFMLYFMLYIPRSSHGTRSSGWSPYGLMAVKVISGAIGETLAHRPKWGSKASKKKNESAENISSWRNDTLSIVHFCTIAHYFALNTAE